MFFSFGVVTLQVATGKYPEVTGAINADAETDRRHHHISLLSDKNPLKSLIMQCLNNGSSKHPSGQFLCNSLSKFTTVKISTMELRRERDRSCDNNFDEFCDQILFDKPQNEFKRQTNLEKDKVVKEMNDLVCLAIVIILTGIGISYVNVYYDSAN